MSSLVLTPPESLSESGAARTGVGQGPQMLASIACDAGGAVNSPCEELAQFNGIDRHGCDLTAPAAEALAAGIQCGHSFE